MTEESLTRIINQLIEEGVHNISFVSATHFTEPIAAFLEKHPLPLPVVWNSSGYESLESLKRLEGLVQVYLPDFKYAEEALGRRLSGMPDYPGVALAAVQEMIRQTGPWEMNSDGILQRLYHHGVLIIADFELQVQCKWHCLGV